MKIYKYCFLAISTVLLSIVSCKEKTSKERAREQVDKILKDNNDEVELKKRKTDSLLKIIN